MKMILLDVKNNETKVVNANTLGDYYELIKCRIVEIANRKIGRKRYDIICDEEGLFEDSPKISAISNLGEPMLVGNLLIVGQADEEGNLTNLTDNDIRYIKKRIQKMYTRNHPEGYLMLTQCEW